MPENYDKSYLDKKYFIDEKIYNCPFCNRRHVSYRVVDNTKFNWTNNKDCFVYIVRCISCDKFSFHLSYESIPLHRYHVAYEYPCYFDINEGEELDPKFFYSVPTSFFTIDGRIPKVLRELLSEAEGCQKSNFLTGASACIRKLIYELAIKEDAVGDSYDDRIKSLKKIFTDIDGEYFDSLLIIQQVTSDKVHEDSYEGWDSNHLNLILATITEILNEIYVLPEIKKDKREKLLKLKKEVVDSKNNDNNNSKNN